ncbi:MAG: 4Fe-4S dicluster domain-containing protein [Acidobacteriia bacterium]|nr:4Fe-4S dicluster domain-containing protein [Terriglobia bacterium]
MSEQFILRRENFGELFAALKLRGYQVVGPTVRDAAIVYDELDSVEDLPVGWTDEQDGGTYRLKKRSDNSLFGYVVGPNSWKQFLHPPTVRLWQIAKSGTTFQIEEEKHAVPKRAFIGVRACELRAIAIQDKVFLGGSFVDPPYQAGREGAFLVAVNCGQAGKTCFCVSMNAGPKATAGYDLALTEILEGAEHYFVVEAGTTRGAEVLGQLPCRPAQKLEEEKAASMPARAAAQMSRSIDNAGIKELLYANMEHPRWEEVAARCLSCGNCTMVCPTCFCTTVEDVTDLTGEHAERWQKWDSCFTMDFSYLHGGSIRNSTKARYRQWMTHKLATWIDQFGSSGCVGCGRCITWCPVAIDITEEVRSIRATDLRTKLSKEKPDDGNIRTNPG